MLRYLPLLLLASCGIFGMSGEDAARLSRYQRNAALYWEGGRLGQALDQVRRGLAIDPDNYKLHMVRAWCYLQMSATQPERLRLATRLFEALMEMRSESNQGPQALLGYGLCMQKLGLLAKSEAVRLRDEIKRNALAGEERSEKETEAEKQDHDSRARLGKAEHLFEVLVQRGDQLLRAQDHLMQVRAMRSNLPGAVKSAQAYLERAKTLQKRLQADLERTPLAAYEREVRRKLRELDDNMVEVHAFLANLYYKTGRHLESIQELSQVLLMDPTRTIAYFNRARSLVALGRNREAKRDYEKFLATTPLPLANAHVSEAARAVAQLQKE